MYTKSCNQSEKAQLKSSAISQGQCQDQSKDSQAKQRAETSKKDRKDKKRRANRAKQDRDHQEDSTSAFETNTTFAKKKTG